MVINISFYSFLLVLSINNLISGNIEDISVNYPKESVKIGDKVEIICRSKKFKELVLRRGSTLVVEKCQLYINKLRYAIECKTDQLKLTIKKLDLTDDGNWSCSYYKDLKEFTLRGYDVGKIDMKIMGFQTKPQSDIIGPELMPQSNQNVILIKGRGTKFNPFDLRNNLSIDVTCVSECIYPQLYHTFMLIDKSNISIVQNFTSPIIQKCGKKKYTITNKKLLKCVDFNLKGLIKMSCGSLKPVGSEVISQTSLYILCSTKPIEWWYITMGEKVLTAIGCLIGIMLLLLLYLLVCRWKTNKFQELDECHNSNSVGGVLSGKQENGSNGNGSQVIRGYRV